MDLSIVIVNWNTRDLLRDCLASLPAAHEGLATEVIVVDNASGDGSAAMVRDEHPHVRLIEAGGNLGFSRGNNRMQYVILNGRHIRDRSLQHALGEAYRGLLLTGRFPVAFLRLDLPAEAVAQPGRHINPVDLFGLCKYGFFSHAL